MGGLLVIIGLISYATLCKNEPLNNTFADKTENAINSSEDHINNKITIDNNKATSTEDKDTDIISKEENRNKEESNLATVNKDIELKSALTTSKTPKKKIASKTKIVDNTIDQQNTKSTNENLTSSLMKNGDLKEEISSNKANITTSNNESELKSDQHTDNYNSNIPPEDKPKTKLALIEKKSDSPSNNPISSLSPNRFKKENPNNSTTSLTLQSLLAQLENNMLLPLMTEEKFPELLPPTIKPKKKPSPLSIGFHFGYGFAKKQLKARTSDQESTAYLELRKDSETAMQVLSSGFDLAYQFKSGFYAKAGLQFEQITERFDYSKITTTPFFNDTATYALYYNMNGSIEKDSGTESMSVRTQTRKIYNRYRTVDLPFSIGYQPITKKNLNWFVETGVSVNLSFLPRGEILDYDEADRIDLSSTSYLKKNIGLSLTAGVGLSYRLTKDVSIWMSPKFRLPLTEITIQEYLLEQQFLRGVVEVGVRLRL